MIFEVPDAAAGQRLDAWAAQASGIGRTEIQRLISGERVLVDGAGASKSLRLEPGQRVEVLPQPGPELRSEPPPVPVRFEDGHLAVVCKPAGLVVHTAAGVTGPTLVDALAPAMELAPAAGADRPGIVHRLDRGTSGLLVIAKHDEAYARLKDMIRERTLRRSYLAAIHGSTTMPRGRIEAPIGRAPRSPSAMKVRADGRPSITEFEVLEQLGDVSYMSVELLTGRTHQIRVHFEHIGHPVVGDPLYGDPVDEVAQDLGLTRPFLHAARLRFAHPMTGREVEVAEDLPADLQGALGRLRARSR